jgi:hypothetical protein
LRAKIEISSIEESDIPALEPESTRAERLAAVREMEWQSKRKELQILAKTHNTPWIELFRISLLNRQPYYIMNVLPYLTEASDFLMGNTFHLAAKIRNVGYGLLENEDKVILFGGVQEQAWFLNPNSQPMVSGTSTSQYNQCVNYAFPVIGDSSTVLLSANVNRKYLMIINNSSNRVWVSHSDTAVVGEGIYIEPGGHYEISALNLYTGSISAICNTGETANLTGVECV